MKKIKFTALLLLILLIIPAFSSCASPKLIETVEGSEFSFELLGSNKLTCVRVRRGGELHSVFDVTGVIFKSLGDKTTGFELLDMNFDGHEDFRIIVSVKGNNRKYQCMLYDADSDSFVLSEKLSEIYAFQADEKTKTLISHKYVYTEEETGEFVPVRYTEQYITSVYEWRDNDPVAVLSVTMSYYAESEIYCLTYSEINSDGILEETKDIWIEPEDIGDYSEYFPDGKIR